MSFLARRLLVVFALAFSICAPAAVAQTAASACAPAARGIPPRAAQARGASGLLQSLAGLGERERDHAIRDELLGGNLPRFLRQVWPATLSALLDDGRRVSLTLCVLSDYLSLGSDDDYLLVPLGLASALTVAGKFGFMLPTRHMVDLIYRQAALRLAPQPLPAGDEMRSTAYLQRHQALVQEQRAAAGGQAGLLTAGHKKDLVLSPRLWSQPGHVAIYGWHRAEGAPIQPLSTVHGAAYADYSHGVRLVSQTAFLDGRPVAIFELLADRHLAALLSDEGPMPQAAQWQRLAEGG